MFRLVLGRPAKNDWRVNRTLSTSILAWLRSFDAVARHGSFTRAADELCISQGAVSQQVKQLEQAIGFPLLVRMPQSLDLTSEGVKLAPVVYRAFSSIRNVLADIAAPDGRVPITLSCSPSIAVRWLTPRLSNLLAEHPTIDFRVLGEFHKLDRARTVMEGVEVAIRDDAGQYQDPEATPFQKEYLFPVASPAFLAAHPTSDSRPT